nr:polymorphic toxin type 44 domain-containing protein [Flavobacterium sp.]
MLSEKGAFESDNRGLFTFYEKSKGGGDFDYAFSTLVNEFKNPASSLFIVIGDYTAHNFANFGNYLWGATGYTLGYDFTTLKIGAHANSLLNPSANGYNSQLDSDDDQRSIIEGAYFAHVNKYRSFVK